MGTELPSQDGERGEVEEEQEGLEEVEEVEKNTEIRIRKGQEEEDSQDILRRTI